MLPTDPTQKIVVDPQLNEAWIVAIGNLVGGEVKPGEMPAVKIEISVKLSPVQYYLILKQLYGQYPQLIQAGLQASNEAMAVEKVRFDALKSTKKKVVS